MFKLAFSIFMTAITANAATDFKCKTYFGVKEEVRMTLRQNSVLFNFGSQKCEATPAVYNGNTVQLTGCSKGRLQLDRSLLQGGRDLKDGLGSVGGFIREYNAELNHSKVYRCVKNQTAVF